MTKNTLKYLLAIGAIILIGFGAFILIQYLQGQNSRKQDEEFVKAWERAYQDDTYGGTTPEETLQLFIDALKKGDTDLAAKYFVIDEQEKWKIDLAKIKEDRLLDEMVKDLEKIKFQSQDEETARYLLVNTHGEGSPLVLTKNANNKWKVRTL